MVFKLSNWWNWSFIVTDPVLPAVLITITDFVQDCISKLFQYKTALRDLYVFHTQYNNFVGFIVWPEQ